MKFTVNDLPNIRDILVLDGGLWNELSMRVSFDIAQDPLWTAKALQLAPQAVFDTHMAYLKAGADIIETCTFQATTTGFTKHLNLHPDKGEELIKEAVAIARNALNEFDKSGLAVNGRNVLIAGSIGPYGAYLCDKSEYHGNYMYEVSQEDLVNLHLPRARCLIEAGVDLLLIETMPSVKEVEILLELIKKYYPYAKIFVSFSVRVPEKVGNPIQTGFGDDISCIHDLIQKFSQVIGFGINCCSPRIVTQFLESSTLVAAEASYDISKLKRLVYPNSGQWDNCKYGSGNNIPSIESDVKQWILSGANVIGGCCQLGASDISKIRSVVDEYNKVALVE